MKALLLGVAALLVVAVGAYIYGRVNGPTWEVGGLYSIRNEEGGFRIAKVLAIDPGIVSVRIYKENFEHRPEGVDPGKLSLGSIHDAGGFGIGHMPVANATFVSWGPVLLSRTTVSESELDGYRYWKESGGGAFR